MTAADDRLPAILDAPHPDGAAAGKTVGANAFRAALDEYYKLRGWDEDGVPTEEDAGETVSGRPALAGGGTAARTGDRRAR